MTRDQAWKKIHRLLGKNARIEINEGMSSPERRQQASERIAFLRRKREELTTRIDARRRELLDVPDFKAMLAESAALRKEMDSHMGQAMHYKFRAGTLDTLIPGFPVFHVRGQGDTWEEVIAEIEKR